MKEIGYLDRPERLCLKHARCSKRVHARHSGERVDERENVNMIKLVNAEHSLVHKSDPNCGNRVERRIRQRPQVNCGPHQPAQHTRSLAQRLSAVAPGAIHPLRPMSGICY